MSDETDARETLSGIPGFANYRGPLVRLGGMTNRVFQVGDHCLRIPGRGTEEYIDRGNEAVAAREAAKAGVSPAVLHFDASGVMLSDFVSGAQTMSPAAFKLNDGAPARAALALRKLHVSGAVFPFRFYLFSMIDDYLKVLSTKDVVLPSGYHDVLREAEDIRTALSVHPAPLVACHCDPLCENFLDTGERMWIVDWEYSGMNDPMWDLGDLSVEAKFDERQDEEMIAAYFSGGPSAADGGPCRHLQGHVRPSVDSLGTIQLCQRESGRGFPRLCRRSFRALQEADAEP